MKRDYSLFSRLENKPCGVRTQEEFLRFIDDGQGSKLYITHLNLCKQCQKAVDEVIDAQVKAFQSALGIKVIHKTSLTEKIANAFQLFWNTLFKK